jgi:hypothetical protein
MNGSSAPVRGVDAAELQQLQATLLTPMKRLSVICVGDFHEAAPLARGRRVKCSPSWKHAINYTMEQRTRIQFRRLI